MIHRDRKRIIQFDLTDEEWARLESLMSKSRKSARADGCKIMNAIFYVLRTCMPEITIRELLKKHYTAIDAAVSFLREWKHAGRASFWPAN